MFAALFLSAGMFVRGEFQLFSVFNENPPVFFNKDNLVPFLDQNLAKMRKIYQQKWAAARAGLEKYLPSDWKILKSEGGMFCFVFGPSGLDEAKFQEACYANKVGFVPSIAFSASGKPLGGFRMCFTPMTPEQIEEGCRRFGEVACSFRS